MTPEARRGRGSYRCGCGASVTVTAAPPRGRRCWWVGCRILATTPEPLRFCQEHERAVAARLGHVFGQQWIEAAAEAGDDWYQPLPEPETPKGSYVYFMRRERLIKIGVSTWPSRRAQGLNASILAMTPGSYGLERELHERFAALRQHGEWFEPGPELLAYINELRTAKKDRPVTI